MNARELEFEAAQLLLVGFAGTEISAELRELLARGVLGVVLFGRNVEDPAQVARLCAELKRAAGRPLLVAVDQEGGSVRRLRAGFTNVPSMRALGHTRDPALAHQVGRLLGRELRAVGIDLNLAPVLDVDTNPQNPVIGARAFASDPEWVGALGVALGRGLEWEGVGACAKHFPGHGDTVVDSHRALPRLSHDLARLSSVELVPFRAWVHAGFGAIMTAHILFDAIDAERPATLSEPVLQGLLRARLGYEGAILSDDIEMRAIAEREGRGRGAALAVRAGVDVVLACSAADVSGEIAAELARARRDDPGFEQRFQVAKARARALLLRWARPAEAPQLEQLATADALRLVSRFSEHEEPLRAADPTAEAAALPEADS